MRLRGGREIRITTSCARERESLLALAYDLLMIFDSSMTPVTDELSQMFAIETAELIGAHHLTHTGKPARQWGLGRLDEETQEFTYTYATDRERIKEIKEHRDPNGVFQSPTGQQTHSTLLKKTGGLV